MTRHPISRIVPILLSLVLLLSGCGQAASSPPTAEDRMAGKLIDLHGGSVHDSAVLLDSEVLAGNNGRTVEDIAAGEPLGYYVHNEETDASGSYTHYWLYHPDGSLWLDCGDRTPLFTMGRWVRLMEAETSYFLDPGTGETCMEVSGYLDLTALGSDRFLASVFGVTTSRSAMIVSASFSGCFLSTNMDLPF